MSLPPPSVTLSAAEVPTMYRLVAVSADALSVRPVPADASIVAVPDVNKALVSVRLMFVPLTITRSMLVT